MALATWYCTHPGERVFDPADGDPLPEADRCCHEECKPTGPQVVLDAERQIEGDADFTLTVADIRRLDIKPGEILVATLPEQATPEHAAHAHAELKARLPEGVKVLVVAGVDLMVLNPQALTDALLDAPAE